MKYYLDTNTCIYFLKGKHVQLKRKLLSEIPEKIVVPSIVKAELLYGAEKSRRKKENLEKILQFLLPFNIVDFGDAEAIEYSKIRADLEKRGEITGPNDLIISAIVKTSDGILVTNNVREFSRVRGLKMEDWFQ